MDYQQLIKKVKQYPIAVVGSILTIALAVLYYLRMPVLPELRDEYEQLSKQVQQIRKNSENAVDLEEHLVRAKLRVAEVEGWDLRIVSSGALPENGNQEAIVFKNDLSQLTIRIFEQDGSYKDWNEEQLQARGDDLSMFKAYISDLGLWDKDSLSAREADYIRGRITTYTRHNLIRGRLMDFDASIANTEYFLRLKEEAGIEFGGGVPKPSFIDSGKQTKIYNQMQYKLNLVGALPNILEFIHTLKLGHHFFVIDSISLASNTRSAEGSNNVSASVSTRVLAMPK